MPTTARHRARRLSLRACLTAVLLLVTALGLVPAPAPAATRPPPAAQQLMAVKITFTGNGTYTQRIADAGCYDDGGKFRQGTVARDAGFAWTSVYDAIHFSQVQLKPGDVNVGNAAPGDRTVTGTWTRVDPCRTVGGQLTDTKDLGGPSDTGTFVRAKLDGDSVLFQVDPMSFLGDPVRGPYRFNGGKLNGSCCRFGPEFPGIGLTNSLVATVKVALAKVRALNVGAGGKVVIPLQGPVAPWTFTGHEAPAETVAWTGAITLEPACAPNQRVGPGYDEMTGPMKSALNRLYKRFEAAKACYRFTIGYRDQSYQDDLRRRWHAIADSQGPSDQRSYDQVCTAVNAQGFAQCPAGEGGSWRDKQGHARGGPALVSRHTAGQAADITVLWPPDYQRNISRYQAAAAGAGLCGPPTKDAVHVELAYAKGKGDVRCWFPPGPAP